MKKNKMMRIASVLLVAVLLSTCAIFGTFAKYTTEVSSSDKARVAYWGFQSTNSMDLDGFFDEAYDIVGDSKKVASVDGADVIAPGTTSSTTFAFAWDEEVSAYGAAVAVTGPEVAYTFTITVDTVCDELIKNNKNIQWKLDNGSWGTFDQLVASIKALSGEADGSADYQPNKLPDEFTASDDVHTIEWKWIIDGGDATYTVGSDTLNQDQYDTYMANAAELDDVSIKITITATQID